MRSPTPPHCLLPPLEQSQLKMAGNRWPREQKKARSKKRSPLSNHKNTQWIFSSMNFSPLPPAKKSSFHPDWPTIQPILREDTHSIYGNVFPPDLDQFKDAAHKCVWHGLREENMKCCADTVSHFKEHWGWVILPWPQHSSVTVVPGCT